MKIATHTLYNIVFHALFFAAIYFSTHGVGGWSNIAAFSMWFVLVIELLGAMLLSGDKIFMDKLAKKRVEVLGSGFWLKANQFIAAVTVPIAAAIALYDGRFIFASLHIIANIILFVKTAEAYDRRVKESPTRSS